MRCIHKIPNQKKKRIPLIEGGTNDITNIQPLMLPMQFYER